uniref:Uncharacterized protein n=1 Tax=Chromera velia CCMP2878 TaxID=1169474 RepID=A0A0G4GI34_9ALVE|eukprot:Cvel_21926.t1-p1 / transcript=Cvel_21926.t1 / gene=Cvel_21926 / organism=Chromera_velia_CCMP2878 / gene_product=hypothetical protein / transcript_product=hypothetical protein / location=Cvel_scaffold2102:24974-28990(-) / protein_length=1187 / sequence_SO=supercontig / SO=protein_coding / is_pseudo=false
MRQLGWTLMQELGTEFFPLRDISYRLNGLKRAVQPGEVASVLHQCELSYLKMLPRDAPVLLQELAKCGTSETAQASPMMARKFDVFFERLCEKPTKAVGGRMAEKLVQRDETGVGGVGQSVERGRGHHGAVCDRPPVEISLTQERIRPVDCVRTARAVLMQLGRFPPGFCEALRRSVSRLLKKTGGRFGSAQDCAHLLHILASAQYREVDLCDQLLKSAVASDDLNATDVCQAFHAVAKLRLWQLPSVPLLVERTMGFLPSLSSGGFRTGEGRESGAQVVGGPVGVGQERVLRERGVKQKGKEDVAILTPQQMAMIAGSLAKVGGAFELALCEDLPFSNQLHCLDDEQIGSELTVEAQTRRKFGLLLEGLAESFLSSFEEASVRDEPGQKRDGKAEQKVDPNGGGGAAGPREISVMADALSRHPAASQGVVCFVRSIDILVRLVEAEKKRRQRVGVSSCRPYLSGRRGGQRDAGKRGAGWGGVDLSMFVSALSRISLCVVEREQGELTTSAGRMIRRILDMLRDSIVLFLREVATHGREGRGEGARRGVVGGQGKQVATLCAGLVNLQALDRELLSETRAAVGRLILLGRKEKGKGVGRNGISPGDAGILASALSRAEAEAEEETLDTGGSDRQSCRDFSAFGRGGNIEAVNLLPRDGEKNVLKFSEERNVEEYERSKMFRAAQEEEKREEEERNDEMTSETAIRVQRGGGNSDDQRNEDKTVGGGVNDLASLVVSAMIPINLSQDSPQERQIEGESVSALTLTQTVSALARLRLQSPPETALRLFGALGMMAARPEGEGGKCLGEQKGGSSVSFLSGDSLLGGELKVVREEVDGAAAASALFAFASLDCLRLMKKEKRGERGRRSAVEESGRETTAESECAAAAAALNVLTRRFLESELSEIQSKAALGAGLSRRHDLAARERRNRQPALVPVAAMAMGLSAERSVHFGGHLGLAQASGLISVLMLNPVPLLLPDFPDLMGEKGEGDDLARVRRVGGERGIAEMFWDVFLGSLSSEDEESRGILERGALGKGREGGGDIQIEGLDESSWREQGRTLGGEEGSNKGKQKWGEGAVRLRWQVLLLFFKCYLPDLGDRIRVFSATHQAVQTWAPQTAEDECLSGKSPEKAKEDAQRITTADRGLERNVSGEKDVARCLLPVVHIPALSLKQLERIYQWTPTEIYFFKTN